MPGQEGESRLLSYLRNSLFFLGDSLFFSEIRGYEIGDQDLTQNAPNARNWRLQTSHALLNFAIGRASFALPENHPSVNQDSPHFCNESHGGLMVRGLMVDHQMGSLQRPVPLMGMSPGHCSLTPE